MRIIKCDICSGTIDKWDQSYGVSEPGQISKHEICIPCSKPIANFLKKTGLSKKLK